MTCRKCGRETTEGAFCPYCGTPLYAQTPRSEDKPEVGYTILGIFLPLVGLILYLVWKDDYPLRAKSCGKGALIAVIIVAALWVLGIVFVILGSLLGFLVFLPALALV